MLLIHWKCLYYKWNHDAKLEFNLDTNCSSIQLIISNSNAKWLIQIKKTYLNHLINC